MHCYHLILEALKKHNFKDRVYDNVIFANRNNTFVAITISTTDFKNFTASIIVKNLLSGAEVHLKDICLEILENNTFPNSGFVASLINEVTKYDYKFVFRIIVKNIRKSLRLTQKQFAKRIDVPISTYRKWEQGVTTPSQVVIKSITNKFFQMEELK